MGQFEACLKWSARIRKSHPLCDPRTIISRLMPQQCNRLIIRPGKNKSFNKVDLHWQICYAFFQWLGSRQTSERQARNIMIPINVVNGQAITANNPQTAPINQISMLVGARARATTTTASLHDGHIGQQLQIFKVLPRQSQPTICDAGMARVKDCWMVNSLQCLMSILNDLNIAHLMSNYSM